MQDALMKATLAEFIGTFVLVFIGGLSVVVVPLTDFGILVPAFAHALIVIGIIYTYGHISGAHINPAVTVGLLVGGKVDVQTSIAYISAQFIGGIVAALLIVALMPEGAQVAMLGSTEAFNYGQTKGVLTDEYIFRASVVEFVLVFFLVSAVYQAAIFDKAGNLAAVAIGFTLAACILAGGALSGASLNPARSLGPAMMAGEFDYILPYCIALFAGGAAAGIFHTRIFPPDEATT